MPRTCRFLLPGEPTHVVQRGHNRSACFHDPQCHQLYLGLLQEFADRDGCAIHAYVLMTNHIHLLLTPAEAHSASEFMRHVNQRYSQYVNRRYQRAGSLWQGRFKASIVDSAEYFFTCQRYIELNPVRAGMVQGPSEYAWSSFKSNAEGYPSTFVKPHGRYLGLGSNAPERQFAYRSLFENPISAEDLALIRAAVLRGKPVGGANFASDVLARLAKTKNLGRS